MKRVVFAALVCAAFGLLAAPALAVSDGEVIIGQQVVLRIRVPFGGFSVPQRVDILTQRLNEFLGSNPFSPADVRVEQRGTNWAVLIGNFLVVTTDHETARLSKSTQENLANTWADNLRRVVPLAKAEPTPGVR